MKKIATGFDAYGTLVDPLEMSQYLHTLIGEKSEQFAEIWRQKQPEYTFRRGLTNRYQDSDVCTPRAMQYTMEYVDVSFSSAKKIIFLIYIKHFNHFRMWCRHSEC